MNDEAPDTLRLTPVALELHVLAMDHEAEIAEKAQNLAPPKRTPSVKIKAVR